jgi:hypothetical protein
MLEAGSQARAAATEQALRRHDHDRVVLDPVDDPTEIDPPTPFGRPPTAEGGLV